MLYFEKFFIFLQIICMLLSHGVMVALQFLALPVKVRVLMRQALMATIPDNQKFDYQELLQIGLL